MSLAPDQRRRAAEADLARLQFHRLTLEVREGRLLLPENPTCSEVHLARLLKPELLALLEEGAEDQRQERAAILEHEAGMSREETERRARVKPSHEGAA